MLGRLLLFTCGLLKQKALVGISRLHGGTCERPSHYFSIDDVWLGGYLAVNRSALHYYSGEISEAHKWAQAAIGRADESGHRTTRRAAHVNLGNIQLSLGDFAKAEATFQTALDCSEPSSLSEVIILENIAHIKLLQQDFEACKTVLRHLEQLTDSRQDVKRAHYSRCVGAPD